MIHCLSAQIRPDKRAAAICPFVHRAGTPSRSKKAAFDPATGGALGAAENQNKKILYSIRPAPKQINPSLSIFFFLPVYEP